MYFVLENKRKVSKVSLTACWEPSEPCTTAQSLNAGPWTPVLSQVHPTQKEGRVLDQEGPPPCVGRKSESFHLHGLVFAIKNSLQSDQGNFQVNKSVF